MLTRGFEPQFEYDVTRDGQRFLIGNILDGPEGSPPRPDGRFSIGRADLIIEAR